MYGIHSSEFQKPPSYKEYKNRSFTKHTDKIKNQIMQIRQNSLKPSDKIKLIQEMIILLNNQPTTTMSTANNSGKQGEYEPYGPEWIKEIMKMRKNRIIENLLRPALMKNSAPSPSPFVGDLVEKWKKELNELEKCYEKTSEFLPAAKLMYAAIECYRIHLSDLQSLQQKDGWVSVIQQLTVIRDYFNRPGGESSQESMYWLTLDSIINTLSKK